MNIEDVIRDMRETAAVLTYKHSEPYVVTSQEIKDWADALEAAMRERDSEISRLKESLYFWLPGVGKCGTERDDRAASDSYLLAGYEGSLSDTAEMRGWLETQWQEGPYPDDPGMYLVVDTKGDFEVGYYYAKTSCGSPPEWTHCFDSVDRDNIVSFFKIPEAK